MSPTKQRRYDRVRAEAGALRRLSERLRLRLEEIDVAPSQAEALVAHVRKMTLMDVAHAAMDAATDALDEAERIQRGTL